MTTRGRSRVARVFLDASYAIALASRTDQHHARAVELASWLATAQVALTTTRPVILEIGNSLARQRYRRAAVTLLESIEQDARIEVISLDEGLYNRASELYKRHMDKEWGLTDCISFVLMRERGLQEALTADDHFRQAGFRALLLPS